MKEIGLGEIAPEFRPPPPKDPPTVLEEATQFLWRISICIVG